MKQNKFVVKIPIPDSDPVAYKEFYFPSIEDTAKFLEITKNTLYSYRTGRLKLKHNSSKKLKGIIVEKLDVYYTSKPNTTLIEESIQNFQKSKLQGSLNL